MPDWDDKVDIDKLDHWALINLLITLFNSPCAPNNLLNNAFNWEEIHQKSSTSLLFADWSNVGTSLAPASASSLQYTWTLDNHTTKYEVHQAALRASVDVQLMLGTWLIHKAWPSSYAVAIKEAICNQSWAPKAIPPITDKALPESSFATSGKINGITPLTFWCQSLDLQCQGFLGIGQLGLLFDKNSFNTCALQMLHTINHTKKVHPGLEYCWLCSAWYLSKDDPSHYQCCRQHHFAQKAWPLKIEDFVIMYCLPHATNVFNVKYNIPLDKEQTVYYNKWVRHVYGLLATKQSGGS